MDIPEDKKVSIVVYKLKSGASTWWKQLQKTRHVMGTDPIRTWSRMKAVLQNRFLPTDYHQRLFSQFHNCFLNGRTISAYIEEFLHLQARCNLKETQDQQVARYFNGLDDIIL